MKFNKMIILTIVLLAILSVGAVSAQDNLDNNNSIQLDSNDDIKLNEGGDDSVNTDKSVYVETDGDDTGSGSENSPYASISKAISSVNASNNAFIYLGSGNFVGENNTDLSINLAHRNYNGSLTIIGQGNGKTVIDASGTSQIFKDIGADSIVTLINITFINGKANLGSAISNSGDLTVDSCVFENNSATAYATLYQDDANNLRIINSVFKGNTADSGNSAVYYSAMSSEDYTIEIVNSTFINGTTSYSWADSSCVYIQCNHVLVENNRFISTSGTGKGSALYVRSDNGKIIRNSFINCSYDGTNDGAILYIGGDGIYLEGNSFENFTSTKGVPIYALMNYNAYLAFNDALVNTTTFKLTCNLTDDQGNPVSSYYKVSFYLDGVKIGEVTSTNGVATLSVSKLLDNGEYELTGTYGDANSKCECNVSDATVTVDFDHNPTELWISPTGDDENGTGSQDNPFKTIKHALDSALTDSVDVTVHMMDGLYNETGDNALSYSSVARITIVGETYGKTVISGNNAKGFLTSGQYTDVILRNLTLVNLTGTSSRSFNVRYLTMEDCIVDNAKQLYAQTSPSRVILINVTWTNSANLIIYNPEIYGCHFENVTSTGTGNLWLATVNSDDVVIIENSKFINMVCTGTSGAGVAYIQGNLLSINNLYDSNRATKSYGALYVNGNQVESINDTFTNNQAGVDYGAVLFTNRNENAFVSIRGAKFINNTAAGNGGALGIYGGEIIDTVFENNTAAKGGAIYMPTHSSSVYLYDLILDEVTFNDNNASNGIDIFVVQSTNANNLNCNLYGMTVTFNNLTTKTLEDAVIAEVTHESGAIIGGGAITFYLDGSRMGVANVENGIAKLDYLGFKTDGTFVLSGDYNLACDDTEYFNATLKVVLDPLKDNVTLYVSNNGSDVDGNGSIDAPYKTIQTALINGYKQSSVIVVRILEGTYCGESNTNITVASSLDITIAGAGRDLTVIDGRDLDWFLNVLCGDGIVKIANMTVANVTMNYVDAKKYNQQPAVSIENGATVAIDNVEFIRCHGTEGGAIYNEGTLTVRDSLFFNNGDSNYGAAIKSTGTVVVYFTEFIANHAKYYSTIYSDGELFLYDSVIQDSMRVNGWTGNAMVIGGKGNITMVNSTIFRSGKTSNELIGTGQTWNNNPGFAISIGSTGNVKVVNSTIDGNNVAYSAQYISNVAFGGTGSIGVFVPYGLEVINTRILNLKDIISGSKGSNYFESCYFENVTYASEGTSYDFNLTITNSYFADGTTMVTKRATAIVDLNNNWWGSNDQPVYKLSNVQTSPDTWLIVALDVVDTGSLQKDIILSFKATDGENVTDLDGAVYPREFTMSAVNGTLDLTNGSIDGKVVAKLTASEGNGYTVFAAVDNQVINLTRLNADISASAEPIHIGQNATVVMSLPENLTGDIFVYINGNKYPVVINGTEAVATIPDLPVGNYTATVEFMGDETYTSKSIELPVKVIDIIIQVPDVEKYYKGPENLIITVIDGEGNILANQKLIVTINGKDEEVYTNGTGVASLKLDMDVGKYDVNVLLNTTKASAVVIIKSTVPASNKTAAYNANSGFEATFLDSEGNPLANTDVVMSVNGKNITTTTDVNGVAKLTKAQIGSKVGTYTIKTYNPVTNESEVYSVKLTARLAGNKNVNMFYYDGSVYRVNVYGDNGKLVGAGQLVVIKIGKLTFKVKTNRNGQAVFKIPYTIKPGKFIITATYKGQTVKNVLLVKQVLKTNKVVKVKKSAKRFILTATLKQGKVALKNKWVFIKFYGKNYKVKTNKYGVARVIINKFVINKLRAGKLYPVYAIYLKDVVRGNVRVLK